MKRDVIVWAVAYDNGNIDMGSMRRTRREAIDAFCYDPTFPPWSFWYRKGCRAVKFRLVPLATAKGGE